MEVLRDAILHLLADDPTLEPRDVIVMCPDIETFAPLIQATFGAGEVTTDDDTPADTPERSTCGSDSPTARFARPTRCSASSRSCSSCSPERITASQVLDLADREPVRRRFGFDDDDLTRLAELDRGRAASAGASTPGTARRSSSASCRTAPGGAGLDRVLLGVAMTEDRHRLSSGVLPLDDVDSGVIDLAGRFAELVDRLGDGARRARHATKPIDGVGAGASPTRPTP